MPRTETQTSAVAKPLVYSPVARAFHWTVALLVIITAPIGFVMADRAAHDIFDATTDTMYSTHKLIGLTILALMIARLAYRLTQGAPPSEPTLASWQKGLSHAVHWTLYLLLIAVPIGGYLGISYGDYLDIFGVKIPGLVAKNEDMSKVIFKLHALGATVLLALVALHLAAVFHHAFNLCDGVLARMWPGARNL